MNKILLTSSVFALLATPVFADFLSFKQDVNSGTTNIESVASTFISTKTGPAITNNRASAVDLSTSGVGTNGTPPIEVVDLTDRDENGVRMATVIMDGFSEAFAVSYKKSLVGDVEVIHHPSVDVSSLDVNSLPRWHDDQAMQAHFDHNKGKSDFDIMPFVTLGDENGQ